MRTLLLLLPLLILSTCTLSESPSPEGNTSQLSHAVSCDFVQRVGLLPTTCGNNKCEKWLGEDENVCPQDCRDPLKYVTSYYAQSHVCKEETEVHSPKSMAELSQTVRGIKAKGKTIKMIGTLHSITDIKCPTNGEVIAMGAFNNILGIEDYKGKKTVHLEGNVRFWDLLNYLDKQGYALDKRFPGFGGISVAGFIATGAHGSDTKGSATLASSIVSLEMMGPDGTTKVYDKDNTSLDEWSALRANLGVLGVLTRVRLELRPRYNIAMDIKEYPADILSDTDRFLAEANKCDFLFAHYMRGVGKVYFTCGNETNKPIEYDTMANNLFLPPSASIFNGLAVAGFQQAACSDNVARWLEKTIDGQRAKKPWLTYTDQAGKIVTGIEGVGSWNRMMQTIFDSTTQPKFSQVDWEVAVPAQHLPEVVADLKAFMDRYNVIIPTIGVVFRFDRAESHSLMAPAALDEKLVAGEQMVHIEMPVFSPFGMSEGQFEYLKQPYRDFFLSLIEKYNARPHFGKNDNELFLSPIVRDRMQTSFERFNAAKAKLEPTDTFNNDFMRAVGIR